MIPALFALVISTQAPDGWTPPVTLELFTDEAVCEFVIPLARTYAEGNSQYPATAWCQRLL